MKKHEKLASDVLVNKAIDKLKLRDQELRRRLFIIEKEAELIREGNRVNR